jgi:hypothetical protein
MRWLLPLLLSPALAHAAAPPERVLNYVRPAKDGFTLESVVTERAAGDGVFYRSVTHRGALKMTLAVRLDARHRVLWAEAGQEAGGKKQSVRAEFESRDVTLKRVGKTEKQEAAADAVVTTAPDWSDIFWVVRRYDHLKGGKQTFAGLWIHPVQATRLLDFTVERDKGIWIRHEGGPLALKRYRVTLRSGPYTVWADGDGRVVYLLPTGRPQAAVILSGFEKAVPRLK